MNHPLSPEQISDYRKNGFLSGIQISGMDDSLHYRRLFDDLEETEGREKARIGLIDRHFDVPFILELATNPRILDCVESLAGPNILLLATHFFCKYGPEEKFVAWHQDATYWGLEPPCALTVWLAIDDSDHDNGCMRVIPGTHLGGIRLHGKAEMAGNLLSVNQESPVTETEEASAVDLVLRAGQVSIHDGSLIHGSLPNRSTRRRCGLTIRYVPSSVKHVTLNSMGMHWQLILVRGADRQCNFRYF